MRWLVFLAMVGLAYWIAWEHGVIDLIQQYRIKIMIEERQEYKPTASAGIRGSINGEDE